MDVALFQPMDDLFDSMLFPSESMEGKRARSRLELQHPERSLPNQIDAFLTRDITSANPWEKRQGVQGGFLVSRPSLSTFERYLAFIKEGNYTKGRGEGSGWSGLGYGGFQGAMAYQGVVAFFYDQLAPNTAVGKFQFSIALVMSVFVLAVTFFSSNSSISDYRYLLLSSWML